MHFTEDKHWFEWNLSCVVVLCPAVMAVYQTVLQLPVSVFRGDYSSYPDKRGKLHSTVCLVQCLLNVQRIALHIQGKAVLTSWRRNLTELIQLLNISHKTSFLPFADWTSLVVSQMHITLNSYCRISYCVLIMWVVIIMATQAWAGPSPPAVWSCGLLSVSLLWGTSKASLVKGHRVHVHSRSIFKGFRYLVRSGFPEHAARCPPVETWIKKCLILVFNFNTRLFIVLRNWDDLTLLWCGGDVKKFNLQVKSIGNAAYKLQHCPAAPSPLRCNRKKKVCGLRVII